MGLCRTDHLRRAMGATDRQPQYLGAHRGISRVQIGWTRLYYNGNGYTHAIGNLYGTHAQPSQDDIAAALRVIPVRPRPPTLAHAPTEEGDPAKSKPSGSLKPSAKPQRTAEPHDAAKPESAPKPKPAAKPKA